MERGVGKSSLDSQAELQEDPLSPLILNEVGSGDEATSEDGRMQRSKEPGP